MVNTLTEYPKQDEAELKAMADYYRNQYGNVWFVRCLNCLRVIAVEVPMPNGNTQRGRQIYGYQDLFITTRNRLDKTPDGTQHMIGYQCACGNDTRLGIVEVGEVPTATAIADKAGKIVQAAPPLRSLSPFEREQLRATIAEKQANADVHIDYEINGNIERFESFQLERVA